MIKKTLLLTLTICALVSVCISQRAYAQLNEFKITAADGKAFDEFGRSISISGDYVVVGAAKIGRGSAYVFKRTGTTWAQEAKLLPSDGAAGDNFGLSVSISGEYVVVAAGGDDDNGDGSGSAYVFKRTGTSWAQEAKLLASDGATGDAFGVSVSISGDYVVVGAFVHADNALASGSAYVFKRSDTSWVEEAKLLPLDGVTNDFFGRSVSISGDYVVVGAIGDDDNGIESGSAYIFKRSDTGWVEEAKLLASDGWGGDTFGQTVSIYGDYAVVGASGDDLDDNTGPGSGSAYVFKRSGASWVEEAKLLASDGAGGDGFGSSVSISGAYAVVGAFLDGDGDKSGSAYIFRRRGTSWGQEAKLLASDGAATDRFGTSVSISADYAVVGALGDNDNGDGSGSAYLFSGFNPHLVAYYPFNGNSNDESGIGNDGIVSGATLTEDRFGNPNSAYSFDGVDDYINSGNDPTLRVGSGNFTIQAWVKSDTVGCGDNCSWILLKRGPTDNYWYDIRGYGGQASYNNNGNRIDPTSAIDMNDGKWHQSVFVRDDTTGFLYIDGILQAMDLELNLGSYTGDINDLNIGRSYTAQSLFNYFEGSIDDIRIYDVALTDTAIHSLYREGGFPSQKFSKITSGDIVNDGGNSSLSLWGDYDNDGYIDLFVANFGENNFLYKNNGDGTFTKITEGNIVSDGGYSQGGSWGDYDNDGFLDLIVLNPVQGNGLYRNIGDGTFTKITDNILVTDTLSAAVGASWGDYDNDGFIDLFISVYSNLDNILYRNNGDETFTKITDGEIVNDGGLSGTGNWGDYDNDGYIDLFVANFNENNFLYKNNGDGTFSKIMTGEIVSDGGNSTGSSWGDYDNDGDLDLFVANPNQGNFLYRNNGNGSFTKITDGEIVNIVETWEASSWGDYDNDGDLDLFVANASGSNNYNYLYQNNGDGSFTTVTKATFLTDNNQAVSGAWGDYDNDGFLDLFVAKAQDFNNLLFHNDGNSNSWINLKLIGVVSNASAIGAVVKAKATIDGTPTWQMRQVSGHTGYRTQNSLNAEFGFRDAISIDSIVIKWPSGRTQVLENIMVNQFLMVFEDSVIVGIENDIRIIPTEFSLEQNYPNPFNPETVIEYTLPKASDVTLVIYNLLGEEVIRIIDEEQMAGNHTITWNGSNMPSGIYFYRLQAGDFVQTRKMVLLK